MYNRGFHVQVEVKNFPNFDVKHPPSICKRVSRITNRFVKRVRMYSKWRLNLHVQVECVKNTIKFTTEDLLVLNVRIGEVLNEVELLTNA